MLQFLSSVNNIVKNFKVLMAEPPPRVVVEHVMMKPKKQQRRKGILKPTRLKVWINTYGERGFAPCPFCGTLMNMLQFECGHIVSATNGGEITVENLRPICSMCNKSMGGTNWNDYCDGIGMPLAKV